MNRTVIFWSIALSGLLACSYVVYDYTLEKNRTIEQVKHDFIQTSFLKKKLELERISTLTYQSLRTISLLPSVRQIKGGNRSDEKEDVVKSGRFTVEGALTVQQLYNNLKSNIAVSEIYAVVNGFNPDKEVPFFMFDQVLLSANSKREEKAAKSPDSPEESETDEYKYFPRLLAKLRESASSLDESAELDLIPAFSSPVMRTCDNDQYKSISKGDVKNAEGFVFAVPFYGMDRSLRGAIVAIIRTNVLEASLLDVPRLIVTDDDKKEFEKKPWPIPEVSSFVLVNEETGLFVYDRRREISASDKDAILANLGQVKEGSSVYSEILKMNDKSKWHLVYDFNAKPWLKQTQAMLTVMLLKLFAILGITTAILLFTSMSRRRFLEIARSIQESLGKVSANMSSAGHEALENGRKMSDVSSSLASVTTELSSAITEIESQARNNSDQAKSVQELSGGLKREVEQSQVIVNDLKSSMNTILESTNRVNNLVTAIQDIRQRTEFIEDIVFKTELLSFNASIEAARAGQHGSGFSVVSEQVAQLAGAIKKAAAEISELTQKSLVDAQSVAKDNQERVMHGHTSVTKVSHLVEHVGNLSSQIADVMTMISEGSVQQLAGINEISKTTSQIQNATYENRALAEESLKLGTNLSEQTEEQDKALNSLVKSLMAG